MDTLKVKCSVSGVTDYYTVKWPSGWPIPSRGDLVDTPSSPVFLYVREVVWYPEGDDSGDNEPFVYVVLEGRERP